MIRRSIKHSTIPPVADTIDVAPLEYNQCQEAVKKLTEFLSNELEPNEEEAVQHHLRECRGCFAKFRFEEALLHTIRAKVEQVSAPVSLREKILGLISTPKA